jgi:hypothetical protein
MSLGVLAACQDDESEVITDTSPVSEVGGEYETQETTDSDDADGGDIHSEEEPGEQGICEIDPDAPHPFATALMEYMASYDDVRAYVVTLDDDGTMGVYITVPNIRRVFAYDNDTGKYIYLPLETLFYIQDGELFQIDVSDQWLFVAGKDHRLMSRLYGHTHIVEIIWKLELGRLEVSTRLVYFSDEYLSYLLDDYDAVAEMARRDSLAEYAREKYGLVALPPPDFGHMQNTEDQTAQILAMTISCELPPIIGIG